MTCWTKFVHSLPSLFPYVLLPFISFFPSSPFPYSSELYLSSIFPCSSSRLSPFLSLSSSFLPSCFSHPAFSSPHHPSSHLSILILFTLLPFTPLPHPSSLPLPSLIRTMIRPKTRFWNTKLALASLNAPLWRRHLPLLLSPTSGRNVSPPPPLQRYVFSSSKWYVCLDVELEKRSMNYWAFNILLFLSNVCKETSLL